MPTHDSVSGTGGPKAQRVTLSGGKTVDISFPGVEEGTNIVSRTGPAGPAEWQSRHHPHQPTDSWSDGDDISRSAIVSTRLYRARRKGDGRRSGDASIPGSSSGRPLRLKGRGFPAAGQPATVSPPSR